VTNTAPARPGRFLYIIPLLLLVAAGWFAFGRQLGSANAAEAGTDQQDPRRFRDVGGGIVEDTATGLRRPKVGSVLADAFPEADLEPTRDDLRDGRGPRPIHLSVRVVGVETDIIPIGVDENRAIAVPKQADIAGWWSGGQVAGEPGPTVIVGHYDSKSAPGVFENLKNVGVGARIIVEQSDGSVFLYDVTKVEKIPKSEFPTEAVYGRTPNSTLRLITCGGAFDNDTRHYVDNTIVYADLAVASKYELRADRPITKLSEMPPLDVFPTPPVGVDGGAGELVGPSLPPSETTAAPTTLVPSTTTTLLSSTTSTTTVVTSTTSLFTTTTAALPATGLPPVAPSTAPPVPASAAPPTVPPTVPPAVPPSVVPVEPTVVTPATIPAPPTVPPGSLPVEPGAPPATSVTP
jgi:LPXTG-site transpeptidase (sortase) family protein